MNFKNLQQMKKALIGVIAVAIVALAAFNLNLILNKEAKVSVDLSNPLSLAQGEGLIGWCDYTLYQITWGDCEQLFAYRCIEGENIFCFDGDSKWNCLIHEYDNVVVYTCHNR